MEAMERLLDELGLKKDPEKSRKISELIAEEFGEIESHLASEQSDEALDSLLMLSSALNFAFINRISPLPDLEQWIKRLRDTTKNVAQKVFYRWGLRGQGGLSDSRSNHWGMDRTFLLHLGVGEHRFSNRGTDGRGDDHGDDPERCGKHVLIQL